jgi:hypothetical protein
MVITLGGSGLQTIKIRLQACNLYGISHKQIINYIYIS